MNKKIKLLVLSFITALALVGAGCGDNKKDNSADSSNTSASMDSESSSDVGESSVSEAEILIIGSASVAEFETVELKANVTGVEGEVVWTSSDPTVATVENGWVTALKAGQVVIKASIGDVFAEHTLTVEKTPYTHTIAFSLGSLAMFKGETSSVEANVLFNGEILNNEEYDLQYTWTVKSGDASVATLQPSANGASVSVVGVNVGSVTYEVVTTARGYETREEFTVTVYQMTYGLSFENEAITPVENGYNLGLTLGSEQTDRIAIGNVLLVENGAPGTTVMEVAWSSSDVDTITVENGVIIAKKAGEATLTGTATYDGEALSVCIFVTVAKEEVAIDGRMTIETASDEKMQIPASITENDIVKITINDANVVYDKAAEKGALSNRVVTFDKEGLPSKMADLGEGKTIKIETETKIYSMSVDVYTMIINSKEELNAWQEIAAENAVKEGICIQQQKGFAYSGYFVLGANIEYNDVWQPYKNYEKLWRLSTADNNPDAGNLQDEDGNWLEGIIDEPWTKGEAAGFQGVFDGKGYNINGLESANTYNGFIVVLGKKGVVKNLSFTNAKLGADAGLVVERGQGAVQNVYMEIDSFAEGAITFFKGGSGHIRTVSNVIIDVTDCKLTSLESGYLGGVCDGNLYDGVYVLGVDENLADNLFANVNENSKIGGFKDVTALLSDEDFALSASTWDSAFWTITDGVILPTSIIDGFKGEITFTNTERVFNINSQIILSTNKDWKYIRYSLKEANEYVTIDGNVLSLKEGAIIGETLTVVATSLVDGESAEYTLIIAEELFKLTIDTQFYAEESLSNTAILQYQGFALGTTYVVTANGESASVTVESDGQLVVQIPNMIVNSTELNVYDVVCKSDTQELTFTNVAAVTKILKNAEDLNVLNGAAVGAGNFITGYFLLGNDIDCEDALYEANSYSTGFFRATFDGQGYTISNIKAGSCGIFGALYGAMIKDVNFTNVSIVTTANNFNGLLAGSATNNTTIENVTASFKALEWPYANSYGKNKMTALLVVRWNGTAHTVRNVTLDATGMEIPNALGYELSAVTFENVEIISDDVTLIGCTTAYDNETGLESWPIGVIYTDTLIQVEENKPITALDGVVALESEWFEVGETYAVESGFASASVTVEEAGKINVTLQDLALGQVTIVCKMEGKEITFVNVTSETSIQIEETTIDAQAYADGGIVELTSEKFIVDEEYVVTCGVEAVRVTVTENGKLVATFENLTVGETLSVACATEGKLITFTNVFSVTKVLRNAEDLNVLNAANAAGHITGYYILGNDVDCAGATYRSNGRDANKTFQGTFDGQGYTISNLNAGSNGIFNLIVGGTVKNVNFTDASIVKDNSHFTALLAGQTWGNTTIENVNVSFKTIEWPINNALTDWAATGLLIARWSNAATVKVTNVTIDATGLAITNALGCEITGVQFSDVTVKGDSYALIACTGANSSSGIAEWPTGVTYVDTLIQVEENGAVTALDGVVTLESDLFEVGETYEITSGLASATATVEEAGKVNVTLDGLAIGKVTIVCKTQGKEITFVNVTSETSIQIEETTIDTQMYVDSVVELASEKFVAGEEYVVTCGVEAVRATVTENGKLVATLDGITSGATVSIVCETKGKVITFTNVFVATKILKTADDLHLLNATKQGKKIDGYYVLGGNIDCADALYEAGKIDGSNTFSGTLDGNGYTISNIKAGASGILGTLVGGTVKNINFTGVSIAPTRTADTNYGNMCALLAGSSWGNSLIENVSVTYKEVQWPYGKVDTHGYTGLLVARWGNAANTLRNVTLIAEELTVINALGCEIDTSLMTFENVEVRSADYILFACIGSGNYSTGVASWSDISGVTYTDTSTGFDVVAPAASKYYTFAGENSVADGSNYVFTVTEKVAGLNDFIVLVNGEQVQGVDGTYTVQNVTETLKIKVVHGYVEYGAVSNVTYTDGGIVITNSTSTNVADYAAAISLDYVNYLIAQGYTKVQVYMQPDGTQSNQANIKCSEQRTRTPSNYTTVAEVPLVENTPIIFWCQKDGSGSAIQGQGGYMTVTGLNYFKDDGTSLNPLPKTYAVTAPAESKYYAFTGAASIPEGQAYSFTVTAAVNGLNDFIVLVNGEEVTGNNGTYTVENVTEDLAIKVIHGYIEYGSVSNVAYNGEGSITVTNSTSTSDPAFMAYISADYVNYMMAQGYANVHVYLAPDGTIANQAIVGCGNTIVRTPNNYTTVADVTLKADTMIKFWCQKSGSGSAIQSQGGYMTITEMTFIKTVSLINITAPAENSYYTFNGEASVAEGEDYTFTVTGKVAGLNDFIVLVNGEEVTGNNGTYTVENVTEALAIKVIHGYIEYGSVSSVTYNGDGSITVTNSTSTSDPAFMAYISADYVNYMMAQGYTSAQVYMQPDGTIANQAIVGCGNTIVRTPTNSAVANVTLKADTTIKFWCQKSGSGSAIQSQGGYMTIASITFVK